MIKEKQYECHTEYDPLKQVIVSPPNYMRITQIINETQKYYIDHNIDINKAKKQHLHFVDLMRERGVQITSLEPEEQLNEQVFTRDIGFTIGETFFVSKMKRTIRKAETDKLKQHLNDLGFDYITFSDYPIEGGDVIIDGTRVWIGLSKRTSRRAVEELKAYLPTYSIEMIDLGEDILHLDCAFNIVSPDVAIVYKKGISHADYDKLSEHYDLIEVDDSEYISLGTNVLSLGNKTVISLPENLLVNQALKDRGFQVIKVPFSEIIKSGGSFRCATLPTVRQSK
ncbi:N-Dimethylarginine dimethylaminohydrolase [Pelagirhabdus alkalitolerans]|uniref:N-Dimethylarginine dimethylaminohydrolase n=1 Tax=Pelagirhabdus alkalitolerans TaxID=1612202 RepID=A0A1G6IGF2_9BACI|nr:arginine deiminase family protein [Pelagirhabdus alkalitolerans]SDC05544.1 N-Dimethylarginine dimethylaminohydrolase [Pelagirhabdus alkalitolerans]